MALSARIAQYPFIRTESGALRWRRSVQQANDILTGAETARLLRLSERTLEQWRCRGYGGPVYIRMGRRVCYRRIDIDAWLDRRTVRDTSAA